MLVDSIFNWDGRQWLWEQEWESGWNGREWDYNTAFPLTSSRHQSLNYGMTKNKYHVLDGSGRYEHLLFAVLLFRLSKLGSRRLSPTMAYLGFCEGEGLSAKGARLEAPEAPWRVRCGEGVSLPPERGLDTCCVPPQKCLFIFYSVQAKGRHGRRLNSHRQTRRNSTVDMGSVNGE